MTKPMGLIAQSAVAIVLLSSVAVPTFAQGKEQTATQFYLAYRAAFDKATSIDELLPYMSAGRKKEIESTPVGERAKMFDMVKTFGMLSEAKVVGETKTANGATLTVEGVDALNARTKCSITAVREGGAWKIDKESCKS